MPGGLERLAAALDVSAEEVVDALYVLRAPRDLVGIIPAAARFRDWRQTYTELKALPQIADYARRLVLLDRIADLQVRDPVLRGEVTRHYTNRWTPLRPWTGDSVIVELLLVDVEPGVDADQFEHVSAWLVWLGQRFHVRYLARDAYARYLRGQGRRLIHIAPGSRLYAAFLALHTLAHAEAGPRAALAALAAWIRASGYGRGDVRMALRDGRFDQLFLALKRVPEAAHARDTAQPAEARRRKAAGRVAPELRRLLEGVWGVQIPLRRWHGGSGRVDGEHLSRPLIRYSDRLLEMFDQTDEDELHAGAVVHFFPQPNGEGRSEETDTEGDDPEEAVALHPAFSLFLAESKDLIRGYYAAKGVQNAEEYKNALLRWNKWTLSSAALHAVLALVDGGDAPDGGRVDHCARLVIGLSLLTGRSLAEVIGARVTPEPVPPTAANPVVIDLAQHVLRVRSGRPHLRRRPRDLGDLCHPRADSVRLPWPERWWPLVERVGAHPVRARKEVLRVARSWLRQLDPTLHITEPGIRQALPRILDQLTRGDLGVRKIIADGEEVNAQNIIHYASYPIADVEARWRQAAGMLVGPLVGLGPVAGDARVGSQHPFDLDRLAAHFGEIKRRVRVAEDGQDWPRVFNLLTVYLAYWLGLGVTHRHSLAPVPHVVLAGDWVLLTDKSRKDGSTDRLLPITAGLRAQIDAYVALASALALSVPGLDPLRTSASGIEVHLQYLHAKRGVIPYRPKYQEGNEALAHLPANRGRKVARSESGALAGRYRDAELGHFVRGRHAWDATSTFNASDFHARWLERQEALEQQLGFEVLTVADCGQRFRTGSLLPARRIARVARKEPVPASAPAMERAQVEAWLRDADPDAFAVLMDPQHALAPEEAMELVRHAIEAQVDASSEQQRALAEAACAWVRDKRSIPLFAVRPRLTLTSRVLLDARALQNLGYLQQHVLEPFAKDLTRLPALPSGRGGVMSRRQEQAELGRLIMLSIWRLGLLRWTLIDAWLRALRDGAPMLAQGDNRYQILQVRSEAGRELMQRTVFLDDFTATYLCVERQRLLNEVLPHRFGHALAHHRRAVAEKALQAYLAELGIPGANLSIADMAGAATQGLMMHSAPIVAAYARGELVTEDLGDRELRRLAGLEPARKTGMALEQDAPEGQVTQVRDLAFLRDQLHKRLPVYQLLEREQTPYRSYWRSQFAQYPCALPVEALLCGFAAWLVARADPGVDYTILSWRQRQHIVRVVEVIACAVFGYAQADADWKQIDGDVLVTLAEVSREQFPDRLRHGAWADFHAYLRDAKADHAGFEVGVLGPVPEARVSAKILGADELEAFASRFHSARSGIGNPELRISAQHHVELMTSYGMRRSESAYLRGVDYQGDLCRVQAYQYGDKEHTLKTAWADRPLPIEFAAEPIRAWVRDASGQGFERLIDPDATTAAHPDNFFDAVSRLVKAVTGDDSMGSHHLRHTLISRMVLTLLQDAAGLKAVADAFPWIDGLLVPPAQMQTLLGTEGDAGQGLRALSALVGHSHPTTTVRHYVHVLCIALYGALRKADTLDLSRSFERRMGGKSTVQRWATEVRRRIPEGLDDGQQRRWVNRALRNRFEERLHWAGVDRDETPRAPPGVSVVRGDQEGDMPGWLRFDRLEQVDRSFREGRELRDPAELAAYRAGLQWLASIGSGKKGTALDAPKPEKGFEPHRHILEQVRNGVPIPRRLAAGSATVAAEALCSWLGALHVRSRDDFDWLLAKWAYASERARGYVRLGDAREVARVKDLAGSPYVLLKVIDTRVQVSRRKRSTKPIPLLRIKCLDGRGRVITRDTAAVRWVMSYVAAWWHTGNAADLPRHVPARR